MTHKESARLRRRQISAYIDYIKSVSSCERCNEGRTACLDFHHISPLDKSFALSDVGGKGIKKVKAEISKCIILCANCHRILHAEKAAVSIALAKEEELLPLFELLKL